MRRFSDVIKNTLFTKGERKLISLISYSYKFKIRRFSWNPCIVNLLISTTHIFCVPLPTPSVHTGYTRLLLLLHTSTHTNEKSSRKGWMKTSRIFCFHFVLLQSSVLSASYQNESSQGDHQMLYPSNR